METFTSETMQNAESYGSQVIVHKDKVWKRESKRERKTVFLKGSHFEWVWEPFNPETVPEYISRFSHSENEH